MILQLQLISSMWPIHIVLPMTAITMILATTLTTTAATLAIILPARRGHHGLIIIYI